MTELVMTPEGETHIVVKRRFEAPPAAVYRAHVDPVLIQQWCLGPEGWTMPVCINEGRPGGKMRYETGRDTHDHRLVRVLKRRSGAQRAFPDRVIHVLHAYRPDSASGRHPRSKHVIDSRLARLGGRRGRAAP